MNSRCGFRAKGAVLGIVGLWAVACTDPTEPTGPLLQTSQTQYEWVVRGDRIEDSVSYVFRNETGEAVYLVNCHGDIPAALERMTDETWTMAWAPGRELCLGPPIEIDPGEVFEAEFRIHTWAERLSAGTYRLLWIGKWTVHDYHDFSSGSWGDSLPERFRVSNEFEVRIVDEAAME